MAFRSSSSLTGAGSNTAAVPVPAGAATGDIAVVGIYLESTATISTVPSGFTLKANMQTTAATRGRLAVYWKRLTANDTGTYSFGGWTGNPWRAAACALFSGRSGAGDPFDGTVGTADPSSGNVTTLAVSTSPAAAAGDAIGLWTNFTGGNAYAPPTNYTERVDIDVICLDTRDNVASGSTGSISATSNVSGPQKAFLGVLALATSGDATTTPATVSAVAAIPSPSVTGNSSATATPTSVAAVVSIPTATATAHKYVSTVAGTGNQSYFADQSGNPILVRGYVLWGLLMNAGRWNAGDWQLDLEDAVAALQAMGCNVIYTEPLGNTQNGGATNNGNTHDGVAPFTSTSPVTFNNTFWSRSDYLFDLCEAAGITVFFNWAYSDDLDTAALSGFNSTQFGQYGTELGNRYKTRPNLVWMMGGDYFDTFASQVATVKSSIRATGDTHLFGVQNYPETTSRKDIENNSTQTTGTNSSEFLFVYSYNAIYWGIEYGWTEASPKPVMWGDGHFDQDTTADRKVMRDLTWWTFSSGGRGMIYGSETTWAWGSGALANLTSDTFPNTDMGGMWDLFTGWTNWHLLVPDTDSSFVTAGRGTKGDYVTSSGGGGGEYNSSDTQAQYVTASITPDGTLAVVYFPVDQTITVSATELAAGYTVTWVDPISGATTSETPAGTYSPTGNNSLGGPDWLLVFEATADPDATVTPSTVTGVASIPSPSVKAGSAPAPAAVTAVAAVPSATVRLSVAIAALAVAGVAAVPTATVQAGATTTPAPVTGVAAIPAAVIQAGSVVAVTSVTSVAAIPAPAVSAGGNAAVSPATVVATTGVPAPTAAAGSMATPATVSTVAAVPAPVLSSGTGVTPAAVAGAASVPAPALASGSTATPAAVHAATAIPAPAVTAGGNATAAPGAVTATTAVPSPAVTTGSKVTAAAVPATTAVPAPNVSAGSGVNVSASSVHGGAVIPVPQILIGVTPPSVTGTVAIPAPSLSTAVLVPVFSVSAVAAIPAPAVLTFIPVTVRPYTGVTPRPNTGTTQRP